MKDNYRILHIGDLHFWRIPWNPLELINKRLLGVGNLIVGGRSRKFRQELAPILADRLATMDADAMLFSGDFTSTALKSEFRAAERAMRPAVENFKGPIFAVPGNHDCYTRKELTAPAFFNILGERYGVVREESLSLLNDEIAVLKINATTENKLGSHGRITDKHLDYFKAAFAEVRDVARHIVVLCHFPPEDPPGVLHRDRGLQLHRGERLLKLLGETGLPVLWLHGHHHYRWVYGSPSTEKLTYVNAGAPLMRQGETPPDMGFHELIHGADGFRMETHRFVTADKNWETKEVRLPDGGEYQDLQKW